MGVKRGTLMAPSTVSVDDTNGKHPITLARMTDEFVDLANLADTDAAGR